MHYHPSHVDAIEHGVREAANDARRNHDREPLTHTDDLNEIASDYATTLRYSDEFSHHVGSSPQDRADQYARVRENLHRRQLVGTDATRAATGTVRAWLDSPGHRETLLHPRMRVAGLGVAASTNTAYVVHLLAESQTATAALKTRVGRLSPL
jgi:uncharacterized protein YkwD